MEKKLQEIWKEILQLDSEPKLEESFFDLGGNSYHAATAAQRIEEETGRHIEVSDFYEYDTIESLVKLLN
jgi:acyl carrier protein